MSAPIDHTILVVEDDADVRRAIVRMLFRLGYKVLQAESGEQALLISERYHDVVHLLLADLMLPGMNGMEAAEKLKHTRPDMKVLYMSGHYSNYLAENLPDDASQSFIAKPFSAAELGPLLLQLLARPE